MEPNWQKRLDLLRQAVEGLEVANAAVPAGYEAHTQLNAVIRRLLRLPFNHMIAPSRGDDDDADEK